MATQIHVNDVGTVFELVLKDECNKLVDLSAATALQILFTKPSKSTLTKTAVLTNDGTDGKINYVAIAGDLDEVGSWQVQGRVTTAGGAWSSSVSKFKVHPNLV